MIGGQVGITGHIEIADHTVIYGAVWSSDNIKEPGKSFFGSPVDEARKAQRAFIAIKNAAPICCASLPR